MKDIFLIGYMGCGKTSVGEALHRLTGYPLLDMDAEIVREQNCSVPEIFQTHGETGFREMESDLLLRLCRHQKIASSEQMELSQQEFPYIISCGGGIIECPENVELLRTQKNTFFLYGSPELLFDRIKNDANRPNARADIDSESQRFQHLLALYQKRESLYRKASSHMLSIEQKTPEEIAEEILEKIRL